MYIAQNLFWLHFLAYKKSFLLSTVTIWYFCILLSSRLTETFWTTYFAYFLYQFLAFFRWDFDAFVTFISCVSFFAVTLWWCFYIHNTTRPQQCSTWLLATIACANKFFILSALFYDTNSRRRWWWWCLCLFVVFFRLLMLLVFFMFFVVVMVIMIVMFVMVVMFLMLLLTEMIGEWRWARGRTGTWATETWATAAAAAATWRWNNWSRKSFFVIWFFLNFET